VKVRGLFGSVALSALATVACNQEVQREPREQRPPAAPQEATVAFDGSEFSMEPSTLQAAPVVITFRNDSEVGTSAFFAKFLPGKGPQDLGGDLQAESPEEYFSTLVAAGATPLTGPGETSDVTTSLPEGIYAIGGEGREKPAEFRVVPATTRVRQPEADLRVDAGEFFFKISEPEVAPGPVTIRLSNVGVQGHELVLGKQGGTEADSAFTIAPPPGGIVWFEAELSAGRYDVVCFFPDPETGQHHVDLGMRAELRVV
jgi:plastocyanin